MVPFKIKGQTWGLPRDNATGVMYYNKELFGANGVKDPDANWQWDTSFLDAAKPSTSRIPRRPSTTLFPA